MERKDKQGTSQAINAELNSETADVRSCDVIHFAISLDADSKMAELL